LAKSNLNEDELKKEIESFVKKSRESSTVKTDEFLTFRKEMLPTHFTFYEKICNFSAKILNITPDHKKEAELQNALDTCHINTTTTGVTAFAILFPILFMVIGSILSFVITYFFMEGEAMVFFIFVFLIFGLIMIIPLSTVPLVMANNWRLKASNQMVLSIFYIVSYMRHTSNLELAIKFTSDHIAPPLSLDFKKILWNVETSKYSSIKNSLDAYLETWKKYNMEYVEAMHLIESSLYETTDEKRVDSLEKSMSLILEATYEKMLHFAQNLKSPITMLHMLGVILPILGLVILPLVVSFMGEIHWYHISVLYNFFLPIMVWYLGKTILSTRPTGYGQADITDINPELKKHTFINVNIAGKKYFKINPKWISVFIIIIFVLIGMTPLIMHSINTIQGEHYDYIITADDKLVKTSDMQEIRDSKYSFLGYKQKETKELLGPYGLGATLISMFIPLGVALGAGFYYKSVTKKLVKIRKKTKELEKEFASTIFQLGNRIGDGIPAELAFAKVAEVMENTHSGRFFDLVSTKVATLGMGIEDAIFDKKYGAINKFPSALIESSMKVFVESSKKGPDVASQALINISTYIKEMHRVDERLKDLMAEITSSMKSQINFLAPLISGIVIGLTSMITTIINKLGNQISTLSAETATGTGSGIAAGGLLDLFGDSIPTFYFQIIVGIYVIQITFLLTTMLNTIQNGYDPLNEKHLLGKNISKSGTFYAIIAFIVVLVFNLIAASVVDLNVIP